MRSGSFSRGQASCEYACNLCLGLGLGAGQGFAITELLRLYAESVFRGQKRPLANHTKRPCCSAALISSEKDKTSHRAATRVHAAIAPCFEQSKFDVETERASQKA